MADTPNLVLPYIAANQSQKHVTVNEALRRLDALVQVTVQSAALVCRAFGVSETCYRYGPKLKAENEEIADLLVGLTDARKT